MATILITIGVFIFVFWITVVLIILGINSIYRFVSYNRAKRLFDSYQPRSFKKKRKYVKI